MTARREAQSKLFLSLRLSLRDAGCYSLMVGMGETYIAAFVLALGFSAIDAGLITTIPVVVGSAVQLTLVWIYKHISSYRKWVIYCAKIQALCLLALAFSPYIFSQKSLFTIYIMTCIYWSAGFSAGPAWNAWMGALVPQRLRVHFFSERARRVQIFTFIGILTSGILLHFAEKYQFLIKAFSSTLIMAGLCRFASAYFISQQIEKPKMRIDNLMDSNTSVLNKLKNSNVIILLLYLFILQLTVYIAAPFFSPYMLKELHLDYIPYMILASTTFLSRIIFYPYIQKIADNYGPLKLVWIGTFCLIFTPFLWTLSTAYPYLMGLQILSGIGWGMQELGIFLLLLDRFPTQERSTVLTAVNFLNSIGMLLGSLIGSRIMSQFSVTIETYYLLFTISTIGRIGAALTLPYLDDVPKARRFALFWRIIGLRPNVGAIMRPILYVNRNKKRSEPEKTNPKT